MAFASSTSKMAPGLRGLQAGPNSELGAAHPGVEAGTCVEVP